MIVNTLTKEPHGNTQQVRQKSEQSCTPPPKTVTLYLTSPVWSSPVWPVPPVMGQIGNWGLGKEIPFLKTIVKRSQLGTAPGMAGLSGQP